jgi:sugar/nucleoside kinase (ribokinase family)
MDRSLLKRLDRAVQALDRRNIGKSHVVMLPDFFIDHFVSLESVKRTSTVIDALVKQGGGNLPGVPQQISQGGNAANTALALARLGVSSHLICRTDQFGMHCLQFFLGKHQVDLSGVKTTGKLAITTALEFQKTHANVMLGDPGSVADFSFGLLDAHDHDCLCSSDIVGVVNWNLNSPGTELAQKVFETVKKEGVKTFFDSGDPSPRVKDIPKLIQQVLRNPRLDIFSLNESELGYYSTVKEHSQEGLVRALVDLKKQMSARVDLHTARFSCSMGSMPTIVPTASYPKIYRSTGAGDTWNAADLFAELFGFEDEERLLFANIAAGCYISTHEPIHPTIDTILNFIKKML